MSLLSDTVNGRLASTWSTWWTVSMVTGLCWSIALSLGVLGVFILADGLLRLPQSALAALFGFWLIVTLVAFGLHFVRLLRYRRSLAATARRIELEQPELGSHLINLVQLAADTGPDPEGFRRAALEQAAASVQDVPFDRAADRLSRWRRFLLCMQRPRDLLEAGLALLLVLTIGGVMTRMMPAWRSSVSRVLHPWQFVPSVGTLKITRVLPGDAEVLVGSRVEISAQVETTGKRPDRGQLFVRRGSAAEQALPLEADAERRTYQAVLPEVDTPLGYRLQIGDTQSTLYTLSTFRKPTIHDVEVTYTFPPYLDRAPETVRQEHGDLDAPVGTQATLRVHPSTPVTHGHAEIDGRKEFGSAEDSGNTLELKLWLTAPTTYTIALETAAGHSDPEPRVNRIKIQPDVPPTVQIVQPARESRASAVGSLPIVVQAADDIGLGLVRVELRTGETGDDAAPRTVLSWEKFASPTSALLQGQIDLAGESLKDASAVFIRAVARDRRAVALPAGRLEPQETASAWHQVNLIDPQAKRDEVLARLDDARSALLRILQTQVQARVDTLALARQADRANAARLAGQIRTRQLNIQTDSVAIVASTPQDGDATLRALRTVVNTLAYGEMLEAVRLAETLEKAADPRSAEAATSLLASQDRIIEVLRTLLNDLRRETDANRAEAEKRPDTSLPPDVQDKLRALRDKLAELLKQQSKVVEATEELAKTPVDDFTDKDEKALQDLAATEDDWSKFMADAHSDLSKLPEQDFSNPSLLQEMIAVETELAMAKDALTKKAADIAVPLEQLGAEMAKEMTTNIEKWLPDTPDRERWSQEEPLSDDMKQAPMAELPQELEDIVGDLMEDEEDLFDEMEDVSSSWADSLDKGAGWDAMDGPISNNSARGVTGNRLPNTSEIGGRSGEGRSGKSSGEFVGDSAEGKGGRKTPSRLTPDARVKGQVDDKSKDPVGGATGGGKQSGVGGEGLQGPVPEEPEQAMARLAGKQAALRNKAEGLDLKFNVLKYHHADLNALIGQMRAVENDLRSGRYRNAMRRREVLVDGLGQVRSSLEGEVAIRRDQTVNLPSDIQKDVLQSLQESSPAGWEELNRQYFERLSNAPAKPPASQSGK
jgi:hypothetical protein